jgi:DNA-binding beta-propeller fold protein YncE
MRASRPSTRRNCGGDDRDDGAHRASRLTTLAAGAALAGALGLTGPTSGARALAVDARTRRAFVVNRADGSLSVLDTHSGAVRRTVALERASADTTYTLAVDEQAGRVFVVSEKPPPAHGRVIVLDARTGTVLGRTRVGLAPGTLAVSERTGRVFVTNLDGNTVSVLDAR